MSNWTKVSPTDIQKGDIIFYKGREIAVVEGDAPYQYGHKDRVTLSFNNNNKKAPTFFGSKEVNKSGLETLAGRGEIIIGRYNLSESIEKQIKESLKMAGIDLDEEEDLTKGTELEEIKEGTVGAVAGAAVGSTIGHPVIGAATGAVIGDLMGKIVAQIVNKICFSMPGVNEDEAKELKDIAQKAAAEVLKVTGKNANIDETSIMARYKYTLEQMIEDIKGIK